MAMNESVGDDVGAGGGKLQIIEMGQGRVLYSMGASGMGVGGECGLYCVGSASCVVSSRQLTRCEGVIEPEREVKARSQARSVGE